MDEGGLHQIKEVVVEGDCQSYQKWPRSGSELFGNIKEREREKNGGI